MPRGCDLNLAGRYRLSIKPFWRYQLEDDGTHVTLRPADPPDGGDPDAMAMALSRTSRGLLGMVTGHARSVSGARCPVSFPAQLIACSPEGLTVRSEDELSLDDQCQMRRTSAAPTDKVLLRE
ncbi:MAG: hypothetical protein HY901_31655 [Deltaproteobacteria bacterium]|nr:hypothetical protein [Deltaproteobacteria bacterium]